jgi:alkylhydroperoxidase/carboxymuconolactone decarboxylase family protein YurZ
MTTTFAPPDVRALLTDDELAKLRAGFSNDAMLAGARGSSIAPFPPAQPWVQFLLDYFYGAGDGGREPWPATERELFLLGLLSSRFMGRGLDLAIHVYWGLMAGLSVQRIADALLLTGLYCGVESYTNSLGVLRGVLGLLKDAAGKDPSTGAVVPALAGAFK